jgi:hypothetical protein
MKRTYIFLTLLTAVVLTFGLFSCAGGAEPGDDSWDYYDISEAIDELSEQLMNSYQDTYEARTGEGPPAKRLAILDTVDVNGETTEIGKEISATLQSKLFNPELYSLLERDQIAGLLQEYTFNQSGMVEEITSAELGKLLGAEIVVVCSYGTEEDDLWEETRYRISARIVDLETGEIFAIGRVAYVVEEW